MKRRKVVAGADVTAYAHIGARPDYYEWHDEHSAAAGVEVWDEPDAPQLVRWLVWKGYNSPRVHAFVRPLMWGLGVAVDRRKGHGWHLRLVVTFGPLELEFVL